MKRVKIILFIMLATCLFMACSSDDDIFVTPVVGEVNVLLIQSDNGKTSTGTMYKSGEMYNPPHGYLGGVIRYNDGNELTVYHMNFGANIKGSDVFNILNISLESNQPMSFNNLKAGDTFDSSQFHATAAYTPTWTEAIMRVATVLSGKVTVVGTRNVGDKSYMTLRLTDLRFDAIDHTCIYTMFRSAPLLPYGVVRTQKVSKYLSCIVKSFEPTLLLSKAGFYVNIAITKILGL